MEAERRRIGLVAIGLALGLTACAGTHGRLRGSDEQFYYAQLLLERGKTLEAIEEFERLRSAYPGSRYLDAAIYGLGRAHLERGEPLVAAAHFERIVEDFPESRYRSKARFMLGRAYDESALDAPLDQKYTTMAIEQYALYLVEYPGGPFAEEAKARLDALRSRLARKELRTGEFYLRRRKWEAALLYLDRVLERFPTTPEADEARLGKARALLGLGRVDEARTLLQSILEGKPDPETGRRAAELLHSLEEEVTRLARPDGGES